MQNVHSVNFLQYPQAQGYCAPPLLSCVVGLALDLDRQSKAILLYFLLLTTLYPSLFPSLPSTYKRMKAHMQQKFLTIMKVKGVSLSKINNSSNPKMQIINHHQQLISTVILAVVTKG